MSNMLKKYALFRVIETLISLQGEESLRGIGRKSGVSASTAKACLDYLSSMGLTNIKEISKTHLYTLNLNSPLARHIKIIYCLIVINNSGIVAEMVKKYPSIFSIVLYGSAARGDSDEKSDMDFLVVTREKIKIMPLKSEDRLKQEATFAAYTLSEWKRKAKEDKVFYDRAILDGICLYGEMPMVV